MAQFYLEFKSRAIDTFQQQWYVNVETSYSLNLYTYFKTCFEQEQYLNELLPKYRVALSKLRLASNKLKIVTGRYAVNEVNREQRICTLCVLREIEDDFHFVIKCPAYSAIRSKYISHYFIENLASLIMFFFYSHHILVL